MTQIRLLMPRLQSVSLPMVVTRTRVKIVKKLVLLFLVPMMACALVGSSTVWAGGTFTPVSGIMHYEVVDGAGTQWIDEDGILHIRDAEMTWELLAGEGDFEDGTGSGIYNANIDLATGDGDTQGFHALEFSFGELSGSFAGHADCIYTNLDMVGEFVAHGDGGFAGMKIRETVTLVYSSGYAEYDGILHDPHGGGGNKAAAAESQTWSSVKALYR